MKLYLSSYHLGNNPEKFVDLIGNNKKVAIIANSRDYYNTIESKEKVRLEIEELTQLGLLPEELDLRNYFGKQEELRLKMNSFSTVWVIGGNTFVLRRAMSQSGFDEILKEKKKDPNFVYAGYSAGSCVVTPTLHGLEIVDDPNAIPTGYNSEIIWEGLGFVDFSIAPHYKSDHPESAGVDKTVEYFIKQEMPFKTLRDGEVIIR